jgi:hypothetical protein
LVAAELSQAAYDTYEPANLPPGWVDDLGYYFNDGTNSFSTFVNAATQQVVIAFKGTDTWTQFESDVADEGGAEWESIKGEFASVLAAVRAALPGYQITTDGHSLGGGMAQTAALEYGLSGYGQNSLPISPDAIQDINSAGGLNAALAAWKAEGDTFSEATIAGDITTIAYAGDLDLYTNSITSPNTSTTVLPNIYAGLELDGLKISLEGNEAQGAAVVALAEEAAHGIGDVIAELQPGAANVATVPVAFLLTDESDLNAIAGGFDISDSAVTVAAAFNSLEADASHIQSISFSDPGAPVLTLTASQAAADASLLPKIVGSYDLDVIGVTGQAYVSYQQDYVDGLLRVSEYLSAASAGAPYSLVETDYNYASAYVGEKLFTIGITGESFTGEEQDFDAAGVLRREVLTGVSGQSYTSIAYDYNSSGAPAGVTYDVTNAPGESYFVGELHYGASGALRWETAELENGGLQITGEANGARLFGHGDDVMTGGGSNETFVLGAIFGADAITDFSSHDSGAGHDTISLSRADFASFDAVLSAATNSAGGVLIAAPHGQTLTLDGLDTAALAGLAADFTFHK